MTEAAAESAAPSRLSFSICPDHRRIDELADQLVPDPPTCGEGIGELRPRRTRSWLPNG